MKTFAFSLKPTWILMRSSEKGEEAAERDETFLIFKSSSHEHEDHLRVDRPSMLRKATRKNDKISWKNRIIFIRNLHITSKHSYLNRLMEIDVKELIKFLSSFLLFICTFSFTCSTLWADISVSASVCRGQSNKKKLITQPNMEAQRLAQET